MTEENDALPAHIAEWAIEAARATVRARQASRIAIGMAAFVAVSGIVEAVAIAMQSRNFGGASVTVNLVASALMIAAFLACLLLIAGMFLRLQVARFDLDMADTESDLSDDNGPG